MGRGTLRIYLGAAPGVGKTWAMLNEGWRRSQRGADVVIGCLETHGRPGTGAQARNLPALPRRPAGPGEGTLGEMDVDALLARRPDVALVDDLAHTNASGSLHAKRWEDVEELLGAGISVVSTVNIDELESLGDAVEEIIGARPLETVPDAVVRRADQIEMVDMTPEALRRRMAHGNIYPPERVNVALANQFRPANLAALRQLALLWLADRVEESLQGYREGDEIARPWETRERVVVAMAGSPSGEALIRRAARLAQRARADLVGVHVRRVARSSGPQPEELAAQRALLARLGGHYREVVAGDVADALAKVTVAENGTQLVVGSSSRSRWARLVHPPLLRRILRAARGVVEVHVTPTGGQPAPLSLPRALPGLRLRLAAVSRRRRLTALVLATVAFPVLTFVLSQVRLQVGFTAAVLSFLVVTLAVAAVGGAQPAAFAAVVGFLLSNWFFAPPIHTFTIADPRDFSALMAFLVVAGVVSVLVDRSARRSADAGRARVEASALAAMAGSLLRGGDPLPELVANLEATFELDGVAVLVRQGEGWVTETGSGPAPPTSPEDGSLALPLSPGAVLVVRARALSADDRAVLNSFATQLAVAMDSRRLHAQAAAAVGLAKADEMRAALLAAVSHDLRTPLASIKAAATSLLTDNVVWSADATRALLVTVDDEVDRLTRLVANLLDMSRLHAGALAVQCRATALEDVVEAALTGLCQSAPVEVDVPVTLPRVEADPGLLERVVANLVDNALRFAPKESVVRVEAGPVAGRVDLRVVDRGPGIAVADRFKIFEPFQRLGDVSAQDGLGLGLAVAQGFVEAMGGELDLEDTPGGGTTMVVGLPAARP
ncbi:MAG: ATP-binding protein [Acidimicrobiales bacterium]